MWYALFSNNKWLLIEKRKMIEPLKRKKNISELLLQWGFSVLLFRDKVTLIRVGSIFFLKKCCNFRSVYLFLFCLGKEWHLYFFLRRTNQCVPFFLYSLLVSLLRLAFLFFSLCFHVAQFALCTTLKGTDNHKHTQKGERKRRNGSIFNTVITNNFTAWLDWNWGESSGHIPPEGKLASWLNLAAQPVVSIFVRLLLSFFFLCGCAKSDTLKKKVLTTKTTERESELVSQ